MGAAASTAGGEAASGKVSPLPNDEWVLENVLFFDPQQQEAAGGGRQKHFFTTVVHMLRLW